MMSQPSMREKVFSAGLVYIAFRIIPAVFLLVDFGGGFTWIYIVYQYKVDKIEPLHLIIDD